jgi:peptidyl-prolyl cis-trans isomerase D
MLESMRKGQRWLTGLFVLLIGGVFVFFMGLGQPLQGGPSQGMVVELGDVRMSTSDYLRVRERQAETFRDQLGDQFNSKAGRSFLDSQALRVVVDRAILAHEARSLGFRVGKDEIQRVIASSPGFRDENGRFDSEGFTNWVEYSFGNQRNYIEYMRRHLLGQKMVQLLYSQGDVSDGEARTAALYGLEEVRLAYVALDTEALPPGETVSDEETVAYAAANEDELRTLYEERKDLYEEDARMHLRHILFELATSPTPGETQEARERAEAALARLEAGEDFAALATELSDDIATRDSGGDLGFIEPGDIASSLADAAAALAPGERSGIVESDRGLHVLLLEERVEAGARPFEEVRLDLAREGATRRAAAERADRLSDELATAIREGQSLEDAARERELPIDRTGMVRRRPDGFVIGIGASKELMATAFALREDRPSAPDIFSVNDRLVLIQLLERQEPSEADLLAAVANERDRIETAKRNAFVQNWIENRRSELLESGELRVDNSVVEGS